MKYKQIDNRYKISEYGEIINFVGCRSSRFNPILLNGKIYGGYLRYNMKFDEGRKSLLAHRLVYEHFIGEIPEGFDIHHKDGNRLNNHYSNLESINHKTHVILHWDKRGRKNKIPKMIKDKTKNKTFDLKAYQISYRNNNLEKIKAYQKNYREMRSKSNMKSWHVVL